MSNNVLAAGKEAHLATIADGKRISLTQQEIRRMSAERFGKKRILVKRMKSFKRLFSFKKK